MSRPLRVYVAGPMTGRELCNFPAFFAAEEYLRGFGYEVLNPARNDGGQTPEEAFARHEASGRRWSDYLRIDLAALATNGWQLVDPAVIAGTPADYQRFIQGSKAEFGIAKSGYVAARCGWFSDRSVCYLASGRPVIAQETGFSRFLPTGQGLFAFETEDDVLAAIEALRTDYARHARTARALAEEFFDSDKVLSRLLAQVGVT